MPQENCLISALGGNPSAGRQDATGRIERLEEPFLQLACATPSKPEQVLEFYRKELPVLGWSMRAGTEKVEESLQTFSYRDSFAFYPSGS